MLPLRHHVRQLSGIALLAIMGLVIAPTLSPAMAAGGLHLDHCPLCGLKQDIKS